MTYLVVELRCAKHGVLRAAISQLEYDDVERVCPDCRRPVTLVVLGTSRHPLTWRAPENRWTGCTDAVTYLRARQAAELHARRLDMQARADEKTRQRRVAWERRQAREARRVHA